MLLGVSLRTPAQYSPPMASGIVIGWLGSSTLPVKNRYHSLWIAATNVLTLRQVPRMSVCSEAARRHSVHWAALRAAAQTLSQTILIVCPTKPRSQVGRGADAFTRPQPPQRRHCPDSRPRTTRPVDLVGGGRPTHGAAGAPAGARAARGARGRLDACRTVVS